MGSKLAYRLSPLAEQDLEGIWLYTRERWSAEQADLYYHSIISAIEGLLTGGLIPQPADVLPEGENTVAALQRAPLRPAARHRHARCRHAVGRLVVGNCVLHSALSNRASR